MANSIFVDIEATQAGGEVGFDLSVSDNFADAEALFVSQRELHEAGLAADQDPLPMVAWYMRQSGQAADILQAAIDNHETIHTRWGQVEPEALQQRLLRWDADLAERQLDEHTAAARGKPRNARI